VSKPTLFDVVVIGAGVVGSAIAYRLAQAGAQVTIIEKAYPGAGTSGNTFGWLNASKKPPQTYHDLNLRGIGEHRVLAEEIRSQDCLHLDGALMWGGEEEDGEDAKAQVASRVDSCRARGYHIEEISPEEVKQLEPQLEINSELVDTVYYMPGEGWVEACGLSDRLCEAATQRYGARLIEGESVSAFGTSHGGLLAGVETSGGSRIAADLFVNAAGSAAGAVAALAGASLPVEGSFGVSFVTGAIGTHIRHVIHAPGTSMRPDSPCRVMIHKRNLDSTVSEGHAPISLTDYRCVDALDSAATLLPRLRSAQIESVRVGVRPIPGDGLSRRSRPRCRKSLPRRHT
jgi:glycine/D-amino acid oxidase-like deaminating enzyme